MLLELKFCINSSPDLLAVFLRSLFFSFRLDFRSVASFLVFLSPIFGSYLSSRVLCRALFSNVSFGGLLSVEGLDELDSDGSILCFLRGESLPPLWFFRVLASSSPLSSCCDFGLINTARMELSEEDACFLFLIGGSASSVSCGSK